MEKKILEDLEKTGFINELKIAQKLSENLYKVKLNDSFFDKDLNISREIDIVASKGASDIKNNLTLYINLVIEVKKTSRPWIILTNKLEKVHKSWMGMPGWTLIHGGENYVMNNRGFFTPEDIHKDFMRISKDRIGTAFHESFKSPTDKSNIFKAVLAACKASIYKSEIHFEQHKHIDKLGPEDGIYIEFYHPVVVVDGPLFEVYLDKNNQIQLEKQQWVPVNYEYSSKNYCKHENQSKTFYPDIVQYKFLDNYIKLTNNWLNSMAVNFDKRINQHLKNQK